MYVQANIPCELWKQTQSPQCFIMSVTLSKKTIWWFDKEIIVEGQLRWFRE